MNAKNVMSMAATLATKEIAVDAPLAAASITFLSSLKRWIDQNGQCGLVHVRQKKCFKSRLRFDETSLYLTWENTRLSSARDSSPARETSED